MTHVPHDLLDEFADYAQTIHDLKQHDDHFRNLAQQYHDLNREIERMESGVEPASDRAEEDLRKERVHLKDEIANYLRARAGA